MRRGPPGRGRAKSKPTLQSQIIHFVHHTINVIAEASPHLFDLTVMRVHLFGTITYSCQRIGFKSKNSQLINGTFL